MAQADFKFLQMLRTSHGRTAQAASAIAECSLDGFLRQVWKVLDL